MSRKNKRGVCHKCKVVLENPKGWSCLPCQKELNAQRQLTYKKRHPELLKEG